MRYKTTWKLTEQERGQIFKLWEAKTLKIAEICDMFGITKQTVFNIARARKRGGEGFPTKKESGKQ